MVARGPQELTLSWTGNQPTFQVFRSTTPNTVTDVANRLGETKRRAARTAADVEKVRSRIEIEPFREALEFVGSQPARLAEVVAVRFPADLFPGAEARIGGGIERHMLPHLPSVVPPVRGGDVGDSVRGIR